MNINELMAELAAGEQARAENPKLRGQIDSMIAERNQILDHNQALEVRARDREDQISKLLERIRTAEHERDDALMTQMEADEKLKSFRGTVEKFSSAVASALSGIGAANDKLNPPKPVEPAPAAEVAPRASIEGHPVQTDDPNLPANASPGQSETFPTASEAPIASQIASSEPVKTETVSQNSSPEPRDEAEAVRKSRGQDWYDQNGVNHMGIN